MPDPGPSTSRARSDTVPGDRGIPQPGSPAPPRRRRPGLYRGITRLRDWLADHLLLAPGFAAYGRHTHLALPVRLQGEHRIAVGERVFIGAGCWLQTVDDDGRTALTIDDDVHIAGLCVISAARHVHIRSGALLARGVYIADHGHAFDRPDRPIHAQGLSEPRPTVVGAGAWLGQNVVVLPGARIGAGAVVGANAVVGGTIPDRCLAVGVPARVVRHLDEAVPGHADEPGAEREAPR